MEIYITSRCISTVAYAAVLLQIAITPCTCKHTATAAQCEAGRIPGQLAEPADTPPLTELRELCTLVHNIQCTPQRKITMTEDYALFQKSHCARISTNGNTLFDKLLSILNLSTLVIS